MAKTQLKLSKEEEDFINFLAGTCTEFIINEADQSFKSSGDKLMISKTTPMAILGNTHLLTDLGEDDINKMQEEAFSYHTNAGITFKIVDYSGKSVVVKVVQNKHETQNYFSQKRLIEIVHETFDKFKLL